MLEKLKDENYKNLPKEISNIFSEDISKQVDKEITKNALKIGDKIPDVGIKNAVGEIVHSK